MVHIATGHGLTLGKREFAYSPAAGQAGFCGGIGAASSDLIRLPGSASASSVSRQPIPLGIPELGRSSQERRGTILGYVRCDNKKPKR
jgi:hypothetical protein